MPPRQRVPTGSARLCPGAGTPGTSHHNCMWIAGRRNPASKQEDGTEETFRWMGKSGGGEPGAGKAGNASLPLCSSVSQADHQV